MDNGTKRLTFQWEDNRKLPTHSQKTSGFKNGNLYRKYIENYLVNSVLLVPMNKLSLIKWTAAKYGSGYEKSAFTTRTKFTTT